MRIQPPRLTLGLAFFIFFGPHAFPQPARPDSILEETPQPSVRIVLFTPSDLTAPNEARHRLTQIAEATDKFIFTCMDRWGYPPAVKTLFRRDSDGMVEVLNVRGDMPVSSGRYAKPNYAQDVIHRATRQYHVAGTGNVWWIFIYLGDRPVRYDPWRGTGDPRDGGWAMVITTLFRVKSALMSAWSRVLTGTIFSREPSTNWAMLSVFRTSGRTPDSASGIRSWGPIGGCTRNVDIPTPIKSISPNRRPPCFGNIPSFPGTTKGLFRRSSVKLVDFTPVFVSNQAEDSVTISRQSGRRPTCT